jgi:hypothetical protein
MPTTTAEPNAAPHPPRHPDASARPPSNGIDAWTRHYEKAARRRRAQGGKRWKRPLSIRKRRQRAAVIVAAVSFVGLALLIVAGVI